MQTTNHTRAGQVRHIILRNIGRLCQARFVKGDTQNMRKRKRRHPQHRDMDFTFIAKAQQPENPTLMLVFDEGRQNFRHINLSTVEHLDIIGTGGEILESYTAPTVRAVKADRMRHRDSGRFAPASSEAEPLTVDSLF